MPLPQCIVLDARQSVDSLAGPRVFRWQMGDGHTREGVQFEYCYDQPGRYTVQLDVLDPRTGEVREAELTRFVDLLTLVQIVRFTGPLTARVGEPVSFDLDPASIPACLAGTLRLTWNFHDGGGGYPKLRGTRITHAFSKPGTYRVSLTVDSASPITAECPIPVCVWHEVVVVP